MKPFYLFSLPFLLSVLVIAAAGQTPTPSKDLSNLAKVNDELYRGAQPTEAGIAELKKMGIKTVIDMGNGVEDSKNERTWVEAAGMKYINIHLHNWLRAKDSDVDAILKDLDVAADQPVFLHCKRGSDRTGTVVAIYRMTHDGWTPDKAMDEAKQYGFGWWQFWMKDFINDYYRDHVKK